MSQVAHKCVRARQTEHEEGLAARVPTHLALHHKSPNKSITIMKKLMFAFVTAALLSGPFAKAAYVGTFTGGSYSFEILATSSVQTAVTFMSVVTVPLQIDNMVAVNGSLSATNVPVRPHADRIILLADTRDGAALIRITSGGVPQEVQANPEARLVADVVP
jgi:hypothetical protein